MDPCRTILLYHPVVFGGSMCSSAGYPVWAEWTSPSQACGSLWVKYDHDTSRHTTARPPKPGSLYLHPPNYAKEILFIENQPCFRAELLYILGRSSDSTVTIRIPLELQELGILDDLFMTHSRQTSRQHPLNPSGPMTGSSVKPTCLHLSPPSPHRYPTVLMSGPHIVELHDDILRPQHNCRGMASRTTPVTQNPAKGAHRFWGHPKAPQRGPLHQGSWCRTKRKEQRKRHAQGVTDVSSNVFEPKNDYLAVTSGTATSTQKPSEAPSNHLKATSLRFSPGQTSPRGPPRSWTLLRSPRNCESPGSAPRRGSSAGGGSVRPRAEARRVSLEVGDRRPKRHVVQNPKENENENGF